MLQFQYLLLLQWLMHGVKGGYWFNNLLVVPQPTEKMPMTFFEDDYGNAGSKDINRPDIAHCMTA